MMLGFAFQIVGCLVRVVCVGLVCLVFSNWCRLVLRWGLFVT